MKILHISGSLGLGGAERLAMDLAALQAAQGHDVEVALLWWPSADSSQAQAARQRALELEALGVAVSKIASGTRDVVGAWKSLCRVPESRRPDVVHAHLAVGVIAASGMRPRPPVVWTLHSTEVGFPKRLVRATQIVADRHVGCSQGVTDVFQPYLRRQVFTVPNGVDLRRFKSSYAREPKGPDERLRVLSVGGLRAEKNYPRLVGAVAQARKRLETLGVSIELWIVGDGDQRDAIVRAIARHGADPYVNLLGARSDVDSIMAEVDCYAMASDWEGLPLSLLEAMASGLPCVVTPFGAARDILENGRSGLISATYSESGLADCLVEIGRDPELRLRLSEAAQQSVLRFDIRECAEEYERHYNALLCR